MKISLPSEFSSASPHFSLAARLRNYWGGRRGLFAIGAAAVALGVGLNWGWLTAIGVTPVLLGVLPCAAMCALGLCMPGMMKKRSGPADAARDITLQAKAVTSPPLQLSPSDALPERPFVGSGANVRDAQSCCHPPQAKEHSNANDR